MPKRSFDALIMAEEEAEGGGGSGGGGSNSRKPNSLFVSFSKRRYGLFGKAAKLCSLFDGAQVAVLVLSPTGNPFAFGHSSVDNVLHRYYLRQPTIPISIYPLMITTTAMSDKHFHQAQKVETLKARVKRAKNRNGSAPLRDLKAWIEKAAESCKAVEELESLREKFLALLERVRSRLILRSFSSYGEEEKVVETKPTVVGPADNYVLDLQSVGMAADTSHVFCDMGPPPPPHRAATGLQSDMSYVLETFGHSSEQGKVLVGETSTYGRAPVVELSDHYYFDNQYLISSTGFDQCVGKEGNTAFFAGGSSAANVRSLTAMGQSNDMSFRSMEEFDYSNCGCYCEMEGVSYEQVFNYDQVSMLQLDGFEEVFDRKI